MGMWVWVGGGGLEIEKGLEFEGQSLRAMDRTFGCGR